MAKAANQPKKIIYSIFVGLILLFFNSNGVVFAVPDAQSSTSTPVSGAALSCVSAIGSHTTCTQVSSNTVRINFNVPSNYEGSDIGYRVVNSVPSVFYFWFHWDAGGWWYRYGFDANNTSQARGFGVGLNGLGFYNQVGYFAPVAGNGTYRTNAQGNYWIDDPFVGGDYSAMSNGSLAVRNWEITMSRGGFGLLKDLTGYRGTGYMIVSSVPFSPTPTKTPTIAPTSTRTSTPTRTPTGTPTALPPPNNNGSGSCWSSQESWATYIVYYDILTSPIPTNITAADWVASIEAAAQTWNNVTPSHFNFARQIGSSNTVRYEEPDDETVIAVAAPPISSGFITSSYIKINPRKDFDTNNVPMPGNPDSNGSTTHYNLQNVVTPEFGHWLYLNHSGTNCTGATMYFSVVKGELKKITLNNVDKNAINWQYP